MNYRYIRFHTFNEASAASAGHKTTPYDNADIGTRMSEGSIIFKAVAKVVRGPSTKKAKPFEVGKTYKNNGGNDRTIIAICPDGRLIVDDENGPNWSWIFREDGTYIRGTDAAANTLSDLVPEYEEVPGGLTIEEIPE
jgi:hypothetical protein